MKVTLELTLNTVQLEKFNTFLFYLNLNTKNRLNLQGNFRRLVVKIIVCLHLFK